MNRLPMIPSTACGAGPLSILATVALAAAALSTTLAAQDATETPTKAGPHIVDGLAEPVAEFSKPADWIREQLWVQTDFDSDGDGRNDRMHVDVARPAQTDSEGLKVPVIYETSPYFAGIGSADTRFFWNPNHELGDTPKPRAEMPEVRFQPKVRRLNRQSQARLWVPRGFAMVESSSPGTGLSQGCPTIGGENEALAPKAVIDWLCGRAKGYTTIDGKEEIKADWCTGKVGMTGTSYKGTLPLAAATTGVEGLAAIMPIAPNTSYYHYYRSNGLVRHPGGYMGEDVDVLYDFINSGNPDRRDWCNENVRDDVLVKNADRESGDVSDWWKKRDYLLQMDKLKTPVLMAHAFNDWNVMPEHSVRIYAELKRKGVPCMAYFHQNGHGGPPPMDMQVRWFTRYLLDVENGVEDEPRSWIVRERDRQSEPTPYPEYPHPDAKPVQLFPQPGGGATGALAIAAVAGDDSVIESWVDDVSVAGAKLALAPSSPNRLLFATPELKAPLHLSGTARVSLRIAADRPAANLSVWLVSLPWTGSKRITDDVITRGWADPQNHGGEKGQALTPGEFVNVAFDLQPDDQIIQAGEKIGLMIFSSDRDFTLWPKPGTKLTIDLVGSSLSLPVVGGAAALQKAFAGD